MFGPSLNKLHAHKSIHEGAAAEGRELLEVLNRVFQERKEKHALIAANILLEHWQTRTIAHADSEEEGFYDQKQKENPELKEIITKLKRDHDLLRKLVSQIKEMIQKHGVNDDVIDRFKAFYIISQLHSRDEETYLLEEH